MWRFDQIILSILALKRFDWTSDSRLLITYANANQINCFENLWTDRTWQLRYLKQTILYEVTIFPEMKELSFTQGR